MNAYSPGRRTMVWSLLLRSVVTLTIAHSRVVASGAVTTIQRCGVARPPGAGIKNVSPQSIGSLGIFEDYIGCNSDSAAASESSSAPVAAISSSLFLPARRMSS
jgi:hypothetical protein